MLVRRRTGLASLVAACVLAAVALPGVTSAALPPAPPAPTDSGGHPFPITTGADAATEPIAASRTQLEVPLSGRQSIPTNAMIVAFYGYPGFPQMGALGAYEPDEAAIAARRAAAEYDELNGLAPVVPALHLIAAVAHPTPQENGTYLSRLEPETIERYVEVARRHGILLFLDVQIGWADPLDEVRALAPYLAEPFVHLALDPEFATAGSGAAPGQVIGTLPAEDVNRVQDYLARFVREHELPPKVLVVHQFMEYMLENTDEYDAHPEVEITIDMDGFGGVEAKLSKYEAYALGSYSERPALKLFYEWDTPLLMPADILQLRHPPRMVIYQ
ncbi:MAG: hypothetical protein R3C39_05545 [Dehalococcoidia bacterium]